MKCKMELASNVFSAPPRRDNREKSFTYVPITENTIRLIREAYCKEVLLRKKKKLQNHTAGRSAQGWFQETKNKSCSAITVKRRHPESDCWGTVCPL